MTNAKGSNLISVLFFTNLSNIPLHVTGVDAIQDLHVIEMSKLKGMNVTCDVSIYTLFFESFDSLENGETEETDSSQSLWTKLDVIDCFSIGSVPYSMIKTIGKEEPPLGIGIHESLALLISFVNQGKCCFEDVIEKMVSNPNRIFGFEPQPDTFVEVEIDRPFDSLSFVDSFNSVKDLKDLKDLKLFGNIHRVVVRGKTVFLDGSFFGERNAISLTCSTTSTLTNTNTRRKSSLKSPIVSSNPLTTLESIRDPRNSSPRRTRLASVDSTLGSTLVSSREKDREREREREDKREWNEPTPTLSEYIPRSLTLHSTFFRKHILSVDQFTRSDLHLLFNVAQELRTLVERQGITKILSGKVLCCAFWEPSTRTCCSFETAMIRLGGQVIHVNSITSSIAKGESIGDTGKFFFKFFKFFYKISSSNTFLLFRCYCHETS